MFADGYFFFTRDWYIPTYGGYPLVVGGVASSRGPLMPRSRSGQLTVTVDERIGASGGSFEVFAAAGGGSSCHGCWILGCFCVCVKHGESAGRDVPYFYLANEKNSFPLKSKGPWYFQSL